MCYAGVGRVRQKCCQNHTEYSIPGNEYPYPRIGNYHEGLRDFSSELTMNTLPPTSLELELLMECLGTAVLSLPRIPKIGTSHGGLCMGLVRGY